LRFLAGTLICALKLAIRKAWMMPAVFLFLWIKSLTDLLVRNITAVQKEISKAVPPINPLFPNNKRRNKEQQAQLVGWNQNKDQAQQERADGQRVPSDDDKNHHPCKIGILEDFGFRKLTRQKMSYFLPQDVLTDILARLPFKTILQCRCVSKTWYSLISRSTFATHHLNKTTKTKNSDILLFGYCSRESNGEIEHYFLYPDEGFPDNHLEELDCPFKSTWYGYSNIVGSCDGV